MTRGLKRDEQEQVFHRRLIYDGYGSGEDKRLVNIIKSITKLCLDPDVGDDFVDLSNITLKDISNAINATNKRTNSLQLCDRTFKQLESAIQLKKQDIDCIKSSLNALDLELKFAEKLKRVTSLPDCHTIEQRMKDIEKKKGGYWLKLQKQRIHIKTLMEVCESLAKILDDDVNLIMDADDKIDTS